MSITLLDIWRAARVRSVPFSGESAGYLVFGLCEEMRGAPRALMLDSVELLADGCVRVLTAPACPEAQAEKQLRALLSRLLEVASSPGPSLWRAAGRAPGGGAPGLAAELQKALIPFNRAAARRALLRLFRETERAVADGRLGDLPDSGSEEGLLRLSPPPAKVSEVMPVAVAASAAPVAGPVETPPPQPLQVTEPLALPLPSVALAQHEPEPEQLTRPETVVSRRRARAQAGPPPLPAAEHGVAPRTPRMGSMDVSVIVVPSPSPFTARTRTPSPPPLPVNDELTERAPEVAEFLQEDEFIASEEEESPALVVGVHVADSEDVAEPVNDEEIETRPLPVLAPPMPYEGVSVQPTDVNELLRGFQVAEAMDEAELRRELKALAGVDLTPGSGVEVVPR